MAERSIEPEPTPGQRYVQSRYLRNQARSEITAYERQIDYMLTDAGPDPWNARTAASHRVALELWRRIEQMAEAEMARWHDVAKAYDIEWGPGE